MAKSKPTYRRILVRIWDDEVFCQLTAHEKLVFFNLITNAKAHLSGLYRYPLGYMADDCSITYEEAEEAMHGLEQTGLVAWEPSTGYVFVRNMLRHQGNNSFCTTSAANHIRDMHYGGSLKKEVLQEYPELAQSNPPEEVESQCQAEAEGITQEGGQGGVQAAPHHKGDGGVAQRTENREQRTENSNTEISSPTETRPAKALDQPISKQDREVFEAWKQSLPENSGTVRLTEKRRKKIRARRREGYGQEDLLAAVQGWPNDPWPDRSNQNSLEILLRDGAQVEKFAGLFRKGPPGGARASPSSREVNWPGAETVNADEWDFETSQEVADA